MEGMMWFFADLSHLNWLVWRIISYIVYWFGWVLALFAVLGAIGSVVELLMGARSLNIGRMAMEFLVTSAWLFAGYWLRRWLAAVKSIWPWVTLSREMKAPRERREHQRSLRRRAVKSMIQRYGSIFGMEGRPAAGYQ